MRSAKLPWSLWALCVALTLGAVVLAVLGHSAHGEGTNRFVRVGLDVALLAYPTVGALIASRRSGNPIGWLLIGVGLGAAVSGFAAEYGVKALLADPGSLPGGTIAAWIEQVIFAAFSARLRQEIDLDTLTGELSTAVQETMQPAHVSLWLRTEEAHR